MPEVVSASVRRCGICSSTAHIRTKCDYEARKLKELADAKEAERVAFAARPSDEKILALYDMILALQSDLKDLEKSLEDKLEEKVDKPTPSYW